MNNNRNNEEEAAGRQPAGRGLLGKFRKREDKTPPEILIKKENTDRFTPPRGGLILLQALILIFFFVFVPRFWFLQVHLGEDFARQAQENHWRQEQISAPRGRIFDVKGRVLADNRTAYGLSLIRDDIRDLPATLAQVSEWTGVPLDQVRERYRQSRFKVKSFEPLLLVTDLDFQLVARIESELYAWPGLEIVILTKRSYPEKDLFAHILGYVAEANETELEKNPELSMGDLVGKSGIEYTLDKRLRGRKGLYDIEVDASGRMLGQVLREEPQGGEELKLSLDRDIQKACWDALGTEVGSIVVMEPDTGKLRALVTDTVYCPGGIRLGKQIFHCWRHSGHGSQNLMQAIYNSCDSYFYIMADRLGIDKIESFAKQCGFGRRTGIDLPHEKTGLVPSRAWKHRRFKRGWSRGDTFNASIGQGYVLTTPLQIAVYVSALLNGGDLLKPQLVDTDPKTVTGHVPASRETLRYIVECMRRTAAGGTARVVGRGDAIMGGKTGTAQVVRLKGHRNLSWKEKDHAWIATWGHKNDKTYVVIVMVEHGGGGSKAAGPIARKVYNYLFANPEYYTLARSDTPVRELPGPPLPPEMQKKKLKAQQNWLP